MKTLLYLMMPLLMSLGMTPAITETGTISGFITDKKTGETLIGASIILEQKGDLVSGAVTDLDGHYSITGIKPGTYDIKVQFTGYQEAAKKGIVIAEGGKLTENFKMEASAKELDEVVISGSRYEERVSDASVMYDLAPMSTGYATDGFSSSKSSRASKRADKATSSSIVGVGSASAPASTATISEYKVTTRMADESASKAKVETSAGEIARFTEEKKAGKTIKYLEAEKGARESAAKKMMAAPEMLTKAGKLTAANWCDNRNWDFFTEVMKKEDWSKMKTTWKFDPENRYAIKVKNGKAPASDVAVRLKDRTGKVIWETRTDNNGDAYLFAGLFEKGEDAFEVEVGDKTNFVSQTIGRMPEKTIEIDFATAARSAKILDVMFMIDATGSMDDELSYVKDELNDVISRVKRTQQQMLTVRVSNNVYRDHGDDYVVRSFPFTENMSVALSELNEQSAGGGGDYEEAVEDAFEDAIKNHDWSPSAAARLMFFVLDAPPHKTAENIKKIQDITKLAAAKGIRVIPIASSGVDKDTEFLMRFLSVATSGSYVFLTDDSGIGNSHIEPTIGKYDVEYLNNLLVKVINSYLEEGELMTKK